MIKIAVLGFGIVGQGVYDVIKTNGTEIARLCGAEIEIKYILDKRVFPGHPLENCLVTDMSVIVNDPEVSVVVETMGGEHPAYDFSRAAILGGKSVVTSNKLVVDKRGRELEELAAENGVCYLYEASVGGGIPLIHTVKNCLAVNKIQSVTGILNGTTNFILDRIESSDLSFEEALKLAQKYGYAENDPSSDINGFDTARKISILATLLFGEYFAMEDCALIAGIASVIPEHIAFAAELGCKIKLAGIARQLDDGRIMLFVSPCLVKNNSMLASVSGVFNAVNVRGNMVGDVLIYGHGAGAQATASAVVSDICEIIKYRPQPIICKKANASKIIPPSEFPFDTYIAVKSAEAAEIIKDLGKPVLKHGGTTVFLTKNAAKTEEIREKFPSAVIYYALD